MNIGVIGSGGREHSICFKLKKSKNVSKIYCIPGNAGTSEICENINLPIENFDEIYKTVKEKKIQLLIIGPEVPLVNGITDFFEKHKIMVFGPNKNASKLEGSKAFMKKVCEEFNIPSARYKEISNIKEAELALEKFNKPFVVKSDGLAAGKGVTILEDKQKALSEIKKILDGKFKSSKKVVLEEFLEGEEASYFVITDGKNYLPIGTAQDHKRIGENDTGPNTGGMGAYSPAPLITKDVEEKINKKIIEPTIKGMNLKGHPFKGILYAGLMIKNSEPKLIEYNIRFGDPECQILMMRLKNDLLELILATLEGTIKKHDIHWIDDPGITIVAASKGYPNEYKKNEEIKNLDLIKNDDKQQLFHAGTLKKRDGKIYSNGGRVLNSTVVASSLLKARNLALNILKKVKWDNIYYRKDIGNKLLDK
tara:strand:- start:6750 stop:8018 length:1269 start_codon:yes stop_codon:yes gene_type:complete